jgi:bifunctional non-homologous end joining protein LigD
MRPMLATTAAPGSVIPTGNTWRHEVKWDGMRVLADITGDGLTLRSRTGNDVTRAFPELAGLGQVLADGLLDGEMVAFVDGRPDFGALAERMHVRDERTALALAERRPMTYLAFDVLRLYGVPLLRRPFDERRQTLERLDLAGPDRLTGPDPTAGPDPAAGPRWQVPAIFDDGAALMLATGQQGMEGIVSKRAAAPYQPGRRSPDWVKRTHRSTQTCVVGGWRPQVGTRERLAALLLGLPTGQGGYGQSGEPHDEVGALDFLGRVGSGIGSRMSEDLTRLLGPLASPVSPFRSELAAADAVGTRWVRPGVCVEVSHLGHGRGGRLRQPVLRGLRGDVRPQELRREP